MVSKACERRLAENNSALRKRTVLKVASDSGMAGEQPGEPRLETFDNKSNITQITISSLSRSRKTFSETTLGLLGRFKYANRRSIWNGAFRKRAKYLPFSTQTNHKTSRQTHLAIDAVPVSMTLSHFLRGEARRLIVLISGNKGTHTGR